MNRKIVASLLVATLVAFAGCSGIVNPDETPTPDQQPAAALDAHETLLDENLIGHDDYGVVGEINNTGNVSIDATLRVSFFDEDQNRLQTETIEVDNLEAGATQEFTVEYDGDPEDVAEWSVTTDEFEAA